MKIHVHKQLMIGTKSNGNHGPLISLKEFHTNSFEKNNRELFLVKCLIFQNYQWKMSPFTQAPCLYILSLGRASDLRSEKNPMVKIYLCNDNSKCLWGNNSQCQLLYLILFYNLITTLKVDSIYSPFQKSKLITLHFKNPSLFHFKNES